MQRVVIYQIPENEKVIYNLGQLLEQICIKELKNKPNDRQKIGVLCKKEDLEVVDKALWTFSTHTFVPHNISCENKQQNIEQPILLSSNLEDIKDRNILCVFNGDGLKQVYSENSQQQIIYMTTENVIEEVKKICEVANIEIYKKQNGKWSKAEFWFDVKSGKNMYY